MKNKIDIGLQALLGLILVVFGLNKFLHFMEPPPLPEEASAFFGALAATGYMLTLIATTEIVTGVLLLVRRFSALALVLLAPLSVNIVLFHLFLAPTAGGAGYVVGALNLYLLFVYLPKYRPLLTPK